MFRMTIKGASINQETGYSSIKIEETTIINGVQVTREKRYCFNNKQDLVKFLGKLNEKTTLLRFLLQKYINGGGYEEPSNGTGMCMEIDRLNATLIRRGDKI